MIRKDTTQDTDRPHYYSQYWIDVALGRQTGTTIAAIGPADDIDEFEDVLPPPVKPEPKAAKPKSAEPKKETARPTLTSLADLANIDLLMKNSAAMPDEEVPDISVEAAAPAIERMPGRAVDDEVEISDATVNDSVADEAAPDFEDEEFEDEDEEDDSGWGGGRKPKPTKPRRREPPRRSF